MAHQMRCPDCGGKMEVRAGRYSKFYGCVNYPACKGSHGMHPDGSPKGFPGNAETRAARIRAHAALDRLWKDGTMSRGGAYAWMRTAMGMTRKQAHIAKMTTTECERLIAAIAAR